jgi:hypothetical protein
MRRGGTTRLYTIAVVSEPAVGPHVTREPIGRNRLGWFARADFAIARGILSPLDLCRFYLIVSPPTARLHETVTRWFAARQHLQQPVGDDADNSAGHRHRAAADPPSGLHLSHHSTPPGCSSASAPEEFRGSRSA